MVFTKTSSSMQLRLCQVDLRMARRVESALMIDRTICSTLSYRDEVDELTEDLLRSHRELLLRKQIACNRELTQAIQLDLDKLTQTLLEVKDTPASLVLSNFFAESGVNVRDIRRLLTSSRIYHVGFEIHAPIDLVLYEIERWIRDSQRTLGAASMRVKDTLRFPASKAFQERVGAFAEILRIWLQVNERVLMLELFDIHRPSQAAPSLFWEQADVDSHQRRLDRLFSTDEIWHHALFLNCPADVLTLHAELQELQARDSTYLLPYQAPVHNPHDGSFHTKIIHWPRASGRRRELEFVTAYPSHLG